MNFLIKFFFIFILISTNICIAETVSNKILFELNNKAFTNIDFEKRLKYISITNDLNIKKITNLELDEIFEDYLSTLIFNEYFIIEKINFKNLNEEIEVLYNKNITKKILYLKLKNKEIENIKINLKMDVVRRKIIENFLNSRRDLFNKETKMLDILYNYNLSYITVKEKKLINFNLIDIQNRKDFNIFMKKLSDKNINFLYKNEDINESLIISNLIKNIIKKDEKVFVDSKDGYLTFISLEKKLESYEGVFVKLINFKTGEPLDENKLNCNNVKNLVDIKKTAYKEYEYKKLNEQIKNNLKSANDYIFYKDKNIYNYIMLCELRYDEELFNTINLNKKIDWLVNKIQIKTYRNYSW